MCIKLYFFAYSYNLLYNYTLILWQILSSSPPPPTHTHLQEEQRKQAKRNREELRKIMEDHEEVHSEIRWRRVCSLFEDHPLWKSVNPEERKDVFEDVIFALAKKEKVGVAWLMVGGAWECGWSLSMNWETRKRVQCDLAKKRKVHKEKCHCVVFVFRRWKDSREPVFTWQGYSTP